MSVKGKIVAKGAGQALNRLTSMVDALGMVKDIAAEYTKVKTVAEIEKSKRTEIRAESNVELARIAAKKELIMTYLDRSFDERKENFSRLFDLADQALKSGNNDALAQVSSSIVELAKESPFKALGDSLSTSEALADPNFKWKV